MKPRRAVRDIALALPGFEAGCGRLSAAHIKVLMYHRFCHPGDPGGVDAATLTRQVQMIVRHHDVIGAEELIERVRARRPPARSTVVVTVDDGYRDFLDVAFPVFERFRVPVTVFVATDFIDGQWLWFDRLRYSLLHAAVRHLSVGDGDARFDFALETHAQRLAAWSSVADRCRFLPDEAKWAVLGEVERAADVRVPSSPTPEFAAVTWDEVRMMAARGIAFAPHTASHSILTRIDPDAVLNEVSRSRRALEQNAGISSRAFAYPQGGPADLNDGVIEAVKAAGIEGAFIAYQANASPDIDRFRIPRYQVTGDMLEFRWKLCGANFLYRWLRAALGGRGDEVTEAYWSGSGQGVF